MQATTVLYGQVLVVLAITMSGVWGATQWTAAALGYQSRLGAHWFELLRTTTKPQQSRYRPRRRRSRWSCAPSLARSPASTHACWRYWSAAYRLQCSVPCCGHCNHSNAVRAPSRTSYTTSTEWHAPRGWSSCRQTTRSCRPPCACSRVTATGATAARRSGRADPQGGAAGARLWTWARCRRSRAPGPAQGSRGSSAVLCVLPDQQREEIERCIHWERPTRSHDPGYGFVRRGSCSCRNAKPARTERGVSQ